MDTRRTTTPARARFGRSFPVGLAVSLLLVLTLAACGSDDGASTENCKRIAPVDGVTSVVIVGKNVKFDVECVEVELGTVEFTFDNQDSSVVHNFHVTGHGINEATSLEAGKTTQELVVEVTKPGQYTYSCDPHSSMEGKLIVVDPAAAGATS